MKKYLLKGYDVGPIIGWRRESEMTGKERFSRFIDQFGLDLDESITEDDRTVIIDVDREGIDDEELSDQIHEGTRALVLALDSLPYRYDFDGSTIRLYTSTKGHFSKFKFKSHDSRSNYN